MSTIKVNRILNSSGGEGVDGDIIGNVTAPNSITVGSAVTITDGVIRVGTAVTIDASAGVITATRFDGDGSALSGIDATSLKDSEGNIVAQAVGSGLVITGVTTVSNKLIVGDSYISAGNVGLGTTTTAGRDAGIGTAAGSMIYNATTGSVQVYKENKGWVAIDNPDDTLTGHTATGGIINDYVDGVDTYRSHTFNSSGEFTISSLGSLGDTVEALVVAGGGGGGSSGGGGGGAGGMKTSPLPVTAQTYTVTVGAGGKGAGSSNPTTQPGTNGGDSTFSTLTSTGGGGGGSRTDAGAGNPPTGSGTAGGSGGGASLDIPTGSPASPSGQGNSGSGGTGSVAGGGGGAGGAGIVNPTNGPQSGGNGAPNVYAYGPTGPLTYAGGGGGGGSFSLAPNPGGPGGGGAGGGTSATPVPFGGTDYSELAGAGVPGLGGGGGGASNAKTQAPARSAGGSGGGGAVVIRYKIGSPQSGTAKATGGSVSFYNGKTIHTYIHSGTFVNASPISGVEIVMVAGGGAGGGNIGGGGGAGAYCEGSSITLPANTYTMAVGAGAGGFGGNDFPSTGSPSTHATNSTISWPGPNTWTALAGGNGGGYNTNPSQAGGSGGGGASNISPGSNAGSPATSTPTTTPLGTLTSYGNIGGTAPNPQPWAAGGGGAGGAGNAPYQPGSGGYGGAGKQIPSTFRDPRSAPGPIAGVSPHLLPEVGGGLGAPGPGDSGFWVAGGGAGAAHPYPLINPETDNFGTPGAVGGGGMGGYEQAPAPQSPVTPERCHGHPALENTGSGGGGGGYFGSPGGFVPRSGNGGSGIILIAYPT
tara:strand:+ start:8374 stop:10809 length:2436 start_codon:yes stop_codon:yes gene_type:complete